LQKFWTRREYTNENNNERGNMIKGIILGAVIMYFYLERPEDFQNISLYIEGLYHQVVGWFQSRA